MRVNLNTALALLGLSVAALFGWVSLGRREDPFPQRDAPPGSASLAPDSLRRARAKQSVAPPPATLADKDWTSRLRAAQGDPTLTLSLLEAALAEQPHSPEAAEWTRQKVDALVALDRYPEARAVAEEMVQRFRGTRAALEVERTMGAHPKPR